MFCYIVRNTNAINLFKRYLPFQVFNSSHRKNNIIPYLHQIHTTSICEKKIAFNLSDIGEGIREVTVKEWFVKEGDVVQQFDDLCEVQSDKASVTITSRYDGKILKIYPKVDDIALVGHALVDFEVEDDDDSARSESDLSSSESEAEEERSSGAAVEKAKTDSCSRADQEIQRLITLATPAVRRIAKEHNVDLSKVRATGKQGRVLKGDILEHLGLIPSGSTVPHPTLVKTISPIVSATIPSDRTELLKGVRRVMLKTMTDSLKIPHFAYSDEIDMTKLVDFRNQLNYVAKEEGIGKLTFMPFCIKAASIALSKYPIINSSLDEEKEIVTYKGAHNISVAIDTPQGLVVPNIKKCQTKNIIEIAKDLNILIEKGRKGTLSPEEFKDGTFAISNIGIVGGTYTHPCIMTPQVAIGAMGRTKIVPRFNEKDEIVKAHIMSVSWCADHRVIDGVTMANFSNLWKKYLENPALFLLN